MNDRAEQILEAAIQGFIDTGEPVSSGWLYEQYDFGIKPAMIRLELDALEDAGYLGQPYHSAGRVPTDRGYEFFAERVLMGDASADSGKKKSSGDGGLQDLFGRCAWADLVEGLSAELGLLSVAVDLAHDAVYKNGLQELVDRLDLEDRGAIRSVIRDFEAVDGRLPCAAKKMGNPSAVPGRGEPQVFIGRKSPVTASENLSVVGGNYRVDGATISIFAIGPKRMDYRKTIRIFKEL